MHITHSSRKVIVLERDSQGYISVVLGCLISAISFVLGVNYVLHDLAYPIGAVLCVSSLLFALVPWLITRSLQRNVIQRMVFQHDKGIVRVECGGAEQQNAALLSYNEIHSFALRPSDAQNKTRDESGFFDLVLYFRDASSIVVLSNIYSSQKAEALLRLFQRNVDTTLQPSDVLHAQLPSWLQFQHAATPSFSWTLRQPRILSVFVLLFFCLFFTLLYWFFSQIPNDVFAYVVLGFIATVGVVVMVSLIAKTFGVQRNRSTLTFNDQQIALHTETQTVASGSYESTFGTSIQKSQQSIPLNELAMLGFSPYAVGTSARLYVLSPEALSRAEELLDASAEPAKWRQIMQANLNELLLLHTLPFVDLGERSIVQLLQVRSFLNVVLKEYTLHGRWQPSAVQSLASTQAYSWSESVMGGYAENLGARSAWSSGLSKLLHPRLVGMLALLNTALPALALFAALPIEGRARAGQLVWIFQSLNSLYFAILLLVCTTVLRERSLRPLGVVLSLCTLSYAGAFWGINPSGLSLGFQLFMLSILLVVSGWRLLKIPGAGHVDWAEMEQDMGLGDTQIRSE